MGSGSSPFLFEKKNESKRLPCSMKACQNVTYIRPCRTNQANQFNIKENPCSNAACISFRSVWLCISPGFDGVCYCFWLKSACLRAKRITCAFPVRSVSFLFHMEIEKHVVTNTLILHVVTIRCFFQCEKCGLCSVSFH